MRLQKEAFWRADFPDLSESNTSNLGVFIGGVNSCLSSKAWLMVETVELPIGAFNPNKLA